MRKITFENLPAAVEQLLLDFENLKQLITSEQRNPSEKPINIQEAAKFINLSVATIYSYRKRKQIPCTKKGKKLYFTEKELLEWLHSSRKEDTESVVLKIGKGQKGGVK
jgi:excisionase family DNA binding protein